VLAIGLVVDDAIVVLENVYAKIEGGHEPHEAGVSGTREIFFAVIATTVALVAVLMPIFFLGGLTGRLFREFGATLAGAVIISSFIALTLTPMLCTRLLKRRRVQPWLYRATEPFFRRLVEGYRGSLATFLAHLPTLWQEGEALPTHQQAATPTRHGRTRPDPFAGVWEEVKRWLIAEPEMTAKALFQRIQEAYPNTFTSGQLRTLQRRVRKWRQAMARMLIFGVDYPEAQTPFPTGEEAPATAGTVPSTSAPQSVLCSRGLRIRPHKSLRKYTSTARAVAKWSTASNARLPSRLTPSTSLARMRCPELDTGINSVSPWTIPRNMASNAPMTTMLHGIPGLC